MSNLKTYDFDRKAQSDNSITNSEAEVKSSLLLTSIVIIELLPFGVKLSERFLNCRLELILLGFLRLAFRQFVRPRIQHPTQQHLRWCQ